MSGWPKDMYVYDINGKGAIRCLAIDCGHTFTTNDSMERQVSHYTECELDSSLGRICRNEHGLLKQMHTIKRCLICRDDYLQRDSRELFDHVTKHHPREKPMHTVQGFLTNVREHSAGFRLDSEAAEMFRSYTFKLAYQHLKLNLIEAKIWPDFNDFMGNRGRSMQEDELLMCLTVRPSLVKYYPIDPTSFLSKIKYHEGEHDLSKKECGELRTELRKLYENGWI